MRPLWHDELFTVWLCRLPLSEMIRALRHDSGPPLFYLLEKPLVSLAQAAGDDAIVRLLPLALTLSLFAAAALLPRGRARATFLVLSACSPLLLVYAAEARAYALLAVLGLLLFLLLFHSEPTGIRLAAAGLVAGVALWTHYLAMFLVAACAVVLLVRRRALRAAPLLAGVALFVPWLPVLAGQPLKATAWMREPLGAAGVRLLQALGGGGRVPNPLGGPLPPGLEWMSAVAGLVLAAAVAVSVRGDRMAADAASVTAVTMALVFAASIVRPVAFSGRTEMVILPLWLWTVARLADRARLIRWLALLAAAIGTAGSLVLLSEPPEAPSPARAVALVERLARSDDHVIAAAAFYLPARLSHDRGQLAGTLSAFPPDLALHPGWIALEPPSEDDYGSLEATLRRFREGRVFLLLHPLLRTPRLNRLLAASGRVSTLVERPDALVLVCLISPRG